MAVLFINSMACCTEQTKKRTKKIKKKKHQSLTHEKPIAEVIPISHYPVKKQLQNRTVLYHSCVWCITVYLVLLD